MHSFDNGTLRVESHGDGLWRIEELFASPGGRGAIWVVDGAERRLVIDAGWGLVPLTDHVPELFERPIVAVASHTHFDHIGGLHQFAERLVHPLEAAVLADPDPVTTQIIPYLIDHPDSLAFDPTADGFDVRAWRIPPAPATGTLEDGAVIDLGGHSLVVLHTPGHSPGHLCFYEEERRLLFSVDVVYEGEILDEIPGADVDDLLATHRRLETLDVALVLPGHFAPFDGDRMRALIDSYRRAKAA